MNSDVSRIQNITHPPTHSRHQLYKTKTKTKTKTETETEGILWPQRTDWTREAHMYKSEGKSKR